MKVGIVTGGTGGHIYPALAFADLLKQEKKADIFFIGNDDRMEATLIPETGYVFESLHTSGLSKNPAKTARALTQFGKAYFDAKKILKKYQADLVVGFGGYVSAPVILAADSLGIPAMIHEQNSISGKSNKLVKNHVKKVITCYEKAGEDYSPDKVVQLGNPRATLVVQSQGDREYVKNLGLDPDKPLVMSMMGSLGSSSINELMLEALDSVDQLQILYVCGKNNEMDPQAFSNPNVVVAPYVDTSKVYPYLDGIICRAGATTLAEISAMGIPAVLIPSPYVANNHQFYNAKEFVDLGAALMIEEKDLNADSMKKAIDAAFLNEENRKALAQQARKIGRPDAAYDMIKLACQVIEENSGK